jgi:hypothetical protein
MAEGHGLSGARPSTVAQRARAADIGGWLLNLLIEALLAGHLAALASSTASAVPAGNQLAD